MLTCKRCKRRDMCRELCPAVEGLLPKDETGKDSHREINMDTEAFTAVVERYACAEWNSYETVSKCPKLDLSILTHKERYAFLLLASGLSMRAAARRLGIHLKTFQKRVNKGRAKLTGRQLSHLIEGEYNPRMPGGNGGSR